MKKLNPIDKRIIAKNLKTGAIYDFDANYIDTAVFELGWDGLVKKLIGKMKVEIIPHSATCYDIIGDKVDIGVELEGFDISELKEFATAILKKHNPVNKKQKWAKYHKDKKGNFQYDPDWLSEIRKKLNEFALNGFTIREASDQLKIPTWFITSYAGSEFRKRRKNPASRYWTGNVEDFKKVVKASHMTQKIKSTLLGLTPVIRFFTNLGAAFYVDFDSKKICVYVTESFPPSLKEGVILVLEVDPKANLIARPGAFYEGFIKKTDEEGSSKDASAFKIKHLVQEQLPLNFNAKWVTQ